MPVENKASIKKNILRAGLIVLLSASALIIFPQTSKADVYIYWSDRSNGDGLVDRTIETYNPAGNESIENIVDVDTVLPAFEPPDLIPNAGVGPLRIANEKVYWAIQGNDSEDYTNPASIFQSDLDGSNTDLLMQLGVNSTIIDFEVDVANNRIYYTEVDNTNNDRWIRSSDLDGTNIDDIVQLNSSISFGRMGALTLDTTNQVLYYTDGTYDENYYVENPEDIGNGDFIWVDTVNIIQSYDIVGDTFDTAYENDLADDFTYGDDYQVDSAYRGIEIDPDTGIIYFTNAAGGLYGLQQVDFDGTDFSILTTLLDDDPYFLNEPDRIAIDPLNQYIYFTAVNSGEIYRADFNGDPAGNFDDMLPGEWSYFFESGYTDGESIFPEMQGLDTYNSESEVVPELPPGVFAGLMSVLGVIILRLRMIFQKGASILPKNVLHFFKAQA